MPLLLALLLAALAAVLPASASAQVAHGEAVAKFGPDGTLGTSFGEPASLAYQQANDRLYALAENGINGFSHPLPGSEVPLGGNFPLTASNHGWGADIAVDNSAGASANNIYYASSGLEVEGFDAGGFPLAGWPVTQAGEACGVAVDDSGNAWVMRSSGSLNKFAPTGGSSLQEVSVSAEGEPICKLAIDAGNGDVYVGSSWGGRIIRYTAASGYTASQQLTFSNLSTPRLALDAQRGVLFVGSPWLNEIKVFDTATSELVETIPSPGGATGLAVDESDDTLFVAPRNGQIEELPAIYVPRPTTGDPEGNYGASGTADPDGAGPITECFFEYGSSTSYGSSVDCEEATPILAEETVHATLPGLQGEQTYHYRLVLVNAEGTARGADKTITPHPVKAIATEPATAVTRTTARLHASFEGTGEETTYYFEYGETPSYGDRLPIAPAEETAGVTTGPTQISLEVTGLKPQTTYHFRVVASNGEGTSPGGDREFTTPVAVQGVETGAADEVGKYSALLTGSFTGNGEPHSFHFEWGTSPQYGNVTPTESAGSGTGPVSVSAALSGLQVYLSDTPVYHYRLVVTNATGTTLGPDRTFITLPPDLPLVSGSKAQEVTPTTATLAAEIDPGGGPTIYAFEYGRSTAYGSESGLSDPIAGDESVQPVSTEIGGLEPDATYHFRLVAINFGGTTHGPDVTFRTPAAPVTPPPPPATEGPAASPEAEKPATKKCKRGFVKRHGKCVKKKHRKRHRSKHGRNG